MDYACSVSEVDTSDVCVASVCDCCGVAGGAAAEDVDSGGG